jgi:hypothetical protein
VWLRGAWLGPLYGDGVAAGLVAGTETTYTLKNPAEDSKTAATIAQLGKPICFENHDCYHSLLAKLIKQDFPKQ